MIAYAYDAFRVVVADLDEHGLAWLAHQSGVNVETIQAIAAGPSVPVALSVQMRLGQALGINPLDLFRMEPDVERLLEGAEPRYVSDPATLRAIDH